MKSIKTFEEHTIVNFKDLVGSKNLSAEYYVNKEKGKFPYVKIDGEYVKVDPKKSIPKTAEYLYPEKIEEYNNLAKEIKKLQKELENIL